MLLAGGFAIWKHPPAFDRSPDPLKPRHSQAYAALDEIKKKLNHEEEPIWAVVEGSNETQVGARLSQLEPVLQRAQSNGWIGSFALPTPLWPHPENQASNHGVALALANERDAWREAISTNGFTSNSFVLAENILSIWRRVAAAPGSLLAHECK